MPPNTVFGGQPATYLGDLPDSISQIHADFCKTFYKNFIGVNQQTGAITNQPQPTDTSSARGGPSTTQSQASARTQQLQSSAQKPRPAQAPPTNP